MRTPFVSRIVLRVAPKAGATVRLEPQYGFVGQLTFRNGKKRYFRNQHFDLNPLGASEVAADKDYAQYFMRSMGYRTVEGRAFFSPAWAAAIRSDRTVQAAYRYACRIGFPVFVKPNSRSQGVAVFQVWTKQQFLAAARAIFKKDKVMLVQRPARGNDYRIVVLDDAIISAYERLPLSVIGDGRSTISQLLRAKQREFARSGRDTVISINDVRIRMKLGRNKKQLTTVPKKGERVVLLDNANLSAGGDARDVTKRMHPSIRRLAVSITRDMGLRFCGVDVMIDGDIRKPLKRYRIIEINAAPGLDHYAASGKQQAAVVDRLYTKVLLALKRQR